MQRMKAELAALKGEEKQLLKKKEEASLREELTEKRKQVAKLRSKYIIMTSLLSKWIMSCHKNRMAARIITLWCVYLTPLTTSVSTMRFLFKIMFILNAITSHFKNTYDKQNLKLVVISYEIYDHWCKILYISTR